MGRRDWRLQGKTEEEIVLLGSDHPGSGFVIEDLEILYGLGRRL